MGHCSLCLLQIYNISPEWQYLFDQAGVTIEMLENKKTLQFILDTVHKIGGEPEKIESVLQGECIRNCIPYTGKPPIVAPLKSTLPFLVYSELMSPSPFTCS